MEKIEIRKEKTAEEMQKEKEENYEKIEKITEMFGTEKSRKNFADLLDKYREILRGVKIGSKTEAQTYTEGRSEIHKKIMDTLGALSIHQKPGGEEEKILRSLSDKDIAAQAIEDYYAVKFEKEHPKLTEFGEIYHKLKDDN